MGIGVVVLVALFRTKGPRSIERGHDPVAAAIVTTVGFALAGSPVARGHRAILDPDHSTDASRRCGAGQAGGLPAAHRIVFPEHGRRGGVGTRDEIREAPAAWNIPARFCRTPRP